MKIINMKKFITRIIDLVIIIATFILTPIAINFATIERGYKAYGGEYLLPLIGLIIIMLIEKIYEEGGKKKNGQIK